MAQEAQTDQAPASQAASAEKAKPESQISTVKIVGTRLSQQSSISRKKNAATALDSIVAEDVGSLPDRNIGEAISRMAGVALDRGEFGEGVSVAVRGNGPDLTRVEIDGQAVQSAGGSDNNGGGGGRGTEFRQLSADLIKSVDVVKGSTADMVEGSLGGGIIVKTRTGLDFKEPFVSVRVAGTTNNLNKKWEPDANVILSRKFMDNRLGVLVNASKSTMANEMHNMAVATSSAAGYARAIDFDNSPEKTFTFNPNTLNMADPASTSPTGSYPYTTGTGSWTNATPQDILTKSAAAKSKAECYAAFPQMTTGDAALKSLGTTNRTNAVNARTQELISCLNQWNDYTPSLVRNKVQTELDRRQNLDLRADFKVNRELTVYAKGSYSKRSTENNTSQLGLGGLSVNSPTTAYVDASGKRNVAPGAAGAGYYLYPNNVSYVSGQPAITGAITNVDPSSVVVDAKHHVTSFNISDGAANVDQIQARTQTVTRYFQTGGTWNHGPLKAELLIGDAKSDYRSENMRTNFSSYYGGATMSALPNGLWAYNFPSGSNFDLYNPANYVRLTQPGASGKTTASTTYINTIPAYTQAQQPLLTAAPQLTYSPVMRGTEERTAKLDLTYATPESIPFLSRIKSGFNFRDTRYEAYTGGGYAVSSNPNIVLPAGYVRSSLVGCQDTAGSLGAGGNKCQYGFVPSNRYDSQNSGTVTVTPAQLQDIIGQSLAGNVTNTAFFNGAKGDFGSALTNWPKIDVEKLLALSGAPHINMDCLKSCTANDGKTYDQPVSRMSERSQAAYLMGDFSFDRIPFTGHALPFGLTLEGNMGWRYIRTNVHGVGTMTFESISKTAQFDPANPNATAGINDVKITTNTAVDATTHDFLPILNLAMWVVPDQVVVRYNRARTVARPPVSYLLAQGTCIYDERVVDNGADQRCTSTIGNPALQAQKNLNQNWSAEYYPNKDTMFSLSYFNQKGLIGPALVQSMTGNLGMNLTDPVTGVSLGDMPFDYATWQNGVATTRKGWEFNSKTAFTFLPSVLRYTGLDANYTKLASVTSTQNIVDLLSGNPMPPLRESAFQYNWALWYDDGRLSARVAVQGVASFFNNISGSSSNYLNNYPNASGNTRLPPYNPGSPNFRDATRYVDAKIAYKVTPSVEVFLEGRNLGNATTSNSQGSYVPFANGAPSILDYSYSGRRIMAGINFRYGG